LKKIPKTKPSEQILDLIKSDKQDKDIADKKRSEAVKNTTQYKNKPSTRIEFNHWKNKQVEKWVPIDFVGYYLNMHVEIIGEEDLEFRGRGINERFTKERVYIDLCFEKFFDSKDDFKHFIKWILKWWMSEDSFVTGYPSFWTIFTSNKSVFAKNYKANKSNITKKKIVKSRKQVDNEFANKSAWDAYFDEEEK
jgi:hypothetical protein